MVGLTIGVSESSIVEHDGIWTITDYINSGKVILNNPIVLVDAILGAKVNLKGAP
jgi:hypothetical protein